MVVMEGYYYLLTFGFYTSHLYYLLIIFSHTIHGKFPLLSINPRILDHLSTVNLSLVLQNPLSIINSFLKFLHSLDRYPINLIRIRSVSVVDHVLELHQTNLY